MEKDTVRFGERETAGGDRGKDRLRSSGETGWSWGFGRCREGARGDGVESGIWQVQGGGVASNY